MECPRCKKECVPSGAGMGSWYCTNCDWNDATSYVPMKLPSNMMPMNWTRTYRNAILLAFAAGHDVNPEYADKLVKFIVDRLVMMGYDVGKLEERTINSLLSQKRGGKR